MVDSLQDAAGDRKTDSSRQEEAEVGDTRRGAEVVKVEDVCQREGGEGKGMLI